MLMLSDLCFSKYRRELWSLVCGSVGCDARNEQSFRGLDKKWSVKVPVGSTLDYPKINKIFDKGIS